MTRDKVGRAVRRALCLRPEPSPEVRWTSVAEKLPDSPRRVIVAYRSGHLIHRERTYFACYAGGAWRFMTDVDVDSLKSERVTHWLDLPPIPSAINRRPTYEPA